MSSNPPSDNPFTSIVNMIHDWFNRTPKAQRAYGRLSADLDHVVAKVESFVESNDSLRDLRGKIGAAIDPPTTRPGTEVPTGDTNSAPPTPPPSPSLETGVTTTVPSTVTPPAPSSGSSPPRPATETAPAAPVADTPPPAPPSGSVLPTPSAATPPPPSPVAPENDVEGRRLPG